MNRNTLQPQAVMLLLVFCVIIAFTRLNSVVDCKVAKCKMTRNTKNLKGFTCVSSINKKILFKRVKLNLKVNLLANLERKRVTVSIYNNNKKIFSNTKTAVDLLSIPICTTPIKIARLCLRFKEITLLKKKKCFKCKMIFEGQILKKRINIFDKKLKAGKC
ncbi:hypothetical protein ABK040_013481 [Willaertia magna]